MTWDGVKARVRSLFGASSEDRELEEELSYHLDRETELGLSRGLTSVDARRRARLAFGGYDRIVEETREARGSAWIGNVVRDVRFALRAMRRDARFAVVSVLTLAIGVGAATAVFGVADALLLRPVTGVRAPDELVVVQLTDAAGTIGGLSHANITDLAESSPALSALAGYASRTMQTRMPGGAVEVDATIVGGDYFGVLGLEPRFGRWFTPEELAPDAAGDVIVISDRFRESYFGGAADVLGRTVELNAGRYTVVGVAPAGFHGTLRLGDDDVWLPAAAYGRMWHRPVDAADRRTSMFDELVGRLAAGSNAHAAELQLRAGMSRLVETYPDANGFYADYTFSVHDGIGLDVSARERTKRTVWLLFGSACVLLLIACVNFANLLLFRGVARQGEVAARAALGASRARLVQQQLTEGVVLSAAGGGLGIAVAVAITGLFGGQQLPGLPALEVTPLHAGVIAFALGCALLTGAIFTAGPALLSLRTALGTTLRSFGRSVGDAGFRFRAGLMVFQVAASLALLCGALMLARTVRNLDRVDVGFDSEQVYTFGVSPAPQGYDADAVHAFRQRILEDVSAIRAIESTGVSSFAPFGGDAMFFALSVPGSEATPVRAVTNEVSAEWFETVGVPMIAGRTFSPAEQRAAAGDGPGIVLSASVARALFGEDDAIGRVIDVAGFAGRTQQRVIGVAADVRANPRSGPQPAAYMPIGTASLPQSWIAVRTDVPLERAERLIGDVVARLDPNVPFFTAESLATAIRRSAAEERMLARLLGTFALLAVLLAATGLYGVVSYSVARRRREIGIRMAMGARPDVVVRMVVSRSMQLVIAGSVIGIVGGYAFSRILASRMFGVTPLDATTYLLACAAFGIVALVASAPSAIAAVRVDPLETLRHE